MNNANESTTESTSDSSESAVADPVPSPSESPPIGHNRCLWLLLAAVISVVAGVVVLNQFGNHFQISQEMADLAPDGPRTGEAEVAIARVLHKNQLLVMGLIGAIAGLVFGFAGGKIGKRKPTYAAITGLAIGAMLGLGSVLAAGAVEQGLTITADSTTSVEQQDTQRMLKAAISQWMLFLAICTSAVFATTWGVGSRKWVGILIAVLVSSVISVAVFQAALAIVFPTEPFDRLVPSAGPIAWLWLAIPVLVSVFAGYRLTPTKSMQV